MTEITSSMVIPAQKKPLKLVGLSTLFLSLLIFFTLTKLPQSKITNFISGTIQAGLDPYGLILTDQGREFSIWRGFRYRLLQPTLELPDQTRIELDDLIASPSILPLLTGKAGGSVYLKQGPAKIEITGAGRGSNFNLRFDLDQVDVGKIGILAFAGGIKGSGLVSGSGNIEGSLMNPTSLSGLIQLKLKKVHLDEQNIMGFQLPALNIAEGTVDAVIEGGKIKMKNVQIGKASDDLQVDLTGEITLNRNINSSALDLRAVLGFSEKVKQTFTLIDSLLGVAKQSDGRYAYKLTGALDAPYPNPDPKK